MCRLKCRKYNLARRDIPRVLHRTLKGSTKKEDETKMGRRPKVTTEPVVETTEAAAAAPVVRRRRRRTGAIDHVAQTALLVEALLKTRGAEGASQEELQSVITWARGVHGEADELKTLVGRPRRQKALASPERMAAFELNKALLDNVLAGTIGLNVNASGAIVFIDPVTA
jgi:hypothetical protein